MTQVLFSHYTGIDVSKTKLDICLLPEETFFQVDNNPSGIQQLLQQLPPATAILLEATGGLERNVAEVLHQHGFAVCVINPKLIYHFRQTLSQKAKTDKIDAFVLARFAQQRLDLRYGLYSASQQTLVELQACREQLKKTLKQEKNRLSQTRLRFAQQAHQAVIKTLEKQIERIEKKIQQLIQQDDTHHRHYELLQTIPGIGHSIALTLVTSLPEMGQLKHKALARLVGVAPINQDSGCRRGKRSIQGGRQSVRNALYMAALVNVRHDPFIRHYYQRKLLEGKAKKSVLVACIAKIVRLINSVISNQRPYQMPSVAA